jgi:hypothetical protein
MIKHRRHGWVSEDFTRAERLSFDESSSKKRDQGICWFYYPDIPWSLGYYVSEAGQSNFHVYLWLLKDLAWTECWYWPAMVFGGVTFAWQLFMLGKSIYKRDLEDIWKNISLTLWLGGHFWWMSGELHDYQYPNDPSVYDQRTRQTGEVFIVALVWVSSYYLILKPFRSAGVCGTRPSTVPQNFQHRFPWYFHSWEEYENIHTLFWLAKDTAWNWWIPSMLLVFLVPTFLLAFDFVWVTLWSRRNLIDHAHYVSQLLWVCAASIWAVGEFYLTPNHDDPLALFSWNEETRRTSRWYTGWCYVLAFVPIVVCHVIWIYGTMTGEIEYLIERERDELKDRLVLVSEDAKGSSPVRHSDRGKDKGRERGVYRMVIAEEGEQEGREGAAEREGDEEEGGQTQVVGDEERSRIDDLSGHTAPLIRIQRAITVR